VKAAIVFLLSFDLILLSIFPSAFLFSKDLY